MRTAVLVKLTLVAFIWGGTFIAGRVTAQEMSAPTAAFWRYVVASVALVIVVLVRERRLPPLSRAQWIGVVLLGLTGVTAYNLCFMFGLETVQASRGSLIIALNPALTMMGAALFLHEPLTTAKVAGTAVALLGVSIELSGGNPLALLDGGAGWGEVALFGCALAWSAYTLVGKRLSDAREAQPSDAGTVRRAAMERGRPLTSKSTTEVQGGRITVGVSTLAITTYAALLGTGMLAIAAWLRGDLIVPHASLTAWISIAYMGVLGTAVAFVWFLDGVRALGPARAAIFINLVPVAAIVLGALLLHERITLATIVGGAMVIAGVWIINRPAIVAAAPAAHPS